MVRLRERRLAEEGLDPAGVILALLGIFLSVERAL